jgi:hypothetical protein
MHQTRSHYKREEKSKRGREGNAPYLPFAPKNTPVIRKNLDEQNQKKKEERRKAREKAQGGSPKTHATRKGRK